LIYLDLHSFPTRRSSDLGALDAQRSWIPGLLLFSFQLSCQYPLNSCSSIRLYFGICTQIPPISSLSSLIWRSLPLTACSMPLRSYESRTSLSNSFSSSVILSFLFWCNLD